MLDADNGTAYGIAWPVGTTWNADLRVVRVLNVSASVGDAVTLGGGAYLVSDQNVGDFKWVKRPRPQCYGERTFFVVGISLSRPAGYGFGILHATMPL